jgi:hypothetical protein
VRLVDALIEDAVRAGATDLHLEPEELAVHVRHRIDGVLRQVDTFPRELQPPVVSRLKVVAGLDIAERRLPQEGRVTKPVGGRTVDFRVSSFPTVFGEKIAIRILEPDKLIRGLADLGLNRRGLALVQDLLGRSRGIILVTGRPARARRPRCTGAERAAGARNIMTVETRSTEFPSIRYPGPPARRADHRDPVALRQIPTSSRRRDPTPRPPSWRASIPSACRPTPHPGLAGRAAPHGQGYRTIPARVHNGGRIAQRLVHRCPVQGRSVVSADVLAKAGSPGRQREFGWAPVRVLRPDLSGHGRLRKSRRSMPRCTTIGERADSRIQIAARAA